MSAMPQLAIFAAVVILAIAVGLVLRRRQRIDVPTQPEWLAPTQLDRSDFPGSGTPWLAVVFTSSTCDVCADVARKAQVLANDEITVAEVEYGTQRELHTKYRIDAVPIVVLADRRGVVRSSFIGPVSAADLWASVAAARDRDEADGDS